MKNSPLKSTSWLKLRELMNWVWRELGAHAAFLGFILTLMTAMLDWTGELQPLERLFYNSRTRHFQFFTRPPTDRLVQLDIDDAALDTIGHWPWHRTMLAEIVDELRIAGATELSMDIIFSEAEPLEGVPRPDGSAELIDHDANLAAALRRFGKVVVPVNFLYGDDTSYITRFADVLGALHDNLELLPTEIRTITGKSISEDDLVTIRREAMLRRLEELLVLPGAHPREAIRHQLLPDPDRAPEGSSIQREFDDQFARAQINLEIRRFALNAPDSRNRIIDASTANTMILPFAQAASYTGFVDYLRHKRDPTIDSVPLCFEYRGQVYPQMDLALTCAVLDIDPKKITLGHNQISLPRPDGTRAIIPLHDVRSDDRGKFSMFMDIPWSGNADWTTMYDYPAYKTQKQHMPIVLPWAVAEGRKRLQKTSREADKAVGFFADAGLDSAKAYLKNLPGIDQVDTRIAAWKAVIAEATPSAEQAKNIPENQRNADDKAFFQAFDALSAAVRDMTIGWPELQQKQAQLRAALSGKAVLIGGTSTALNDIQTTPLQDDCPGVVIHGFIFNSIYAAYFWRTAPQWITLLITFAVGWITRLIVSHNHALRALIFTSLLAIGYLLINCLILFDHGKWIVGLAGPMLAIALVWGSGTLLRFIAEAQEHARITRRFQSYVDPALVNFLVAHPEMERVHADVREMTVCFTDLAGFTTFTERLREKAVTVLSRYIARMTPPIRRNGGFIHRFMGDGIFFSYGAPIPNPNMAIGAVAAVLEMHEELAKFNEELAAEGIPKLVMRAGVNTGMAVVGDSGADDAIEYACLGDTTNLAARLEGANTFTGTRSLVSGRTIELLDGSFLLRPIARLVVKGKSEGVMVYEPLARMGSATDDQKRLAAMTTTMFDAYIAADFKACVAAADQLDEAFGASVLTNLYRELSKKYQADPPVDFKGHVVLTDKG